MQLRGSVNGLYGGQLQPLLAFYAKEGAGASSVAHAVARRVDQLNAGQWEPGDRVGLTPPDARTYFP